MFGRSLRGFLRLLLLVALVPSDSVVAQSYRATDLGPQTLSSIAGAPGAVLLAGVSSCDNCAETVTLPFPFDWYGTLVTDIRVTSNGQINMKDQPGHFCCSAPKIPDPDGNDDVLFVCKEDLVPDMGGSIWALAQGLPGSLTFTIEYSGVSFESGIGPVSAQAVLYQNPAGQIDLIWGPIGSSDDPEFSAGVEDGTGTDGTPAVSGGSFDPEGVANEWPANTGCRFDRGCPGSCAFPVQVPLSVSGQPGTRTSLDVVAVDTGRCATDSRVVTCSTQGNDTILGFVAPFSGTATVDTCAAASFDTVLEALAGDCGGEVLDCNDNACGAQSRISFHVSRGRQYLVVVDGSGGVTGSADVTFALAEGGLEFEPGPTPPRVVFPDHTGALALPFTATANGGVAHRLDDLTIRAAGSADDASDVADIHLYLDNDASATLTAADTLRDSHGAGFAVDDGEETLRLGTPLTVTPDASAALLLVYDLTGTGAIGTSMTATLSAATVGLPAGAGAPGLPLTGGELRITEPLMPPGAFGHSANTPHTITWHWEDTNVTESAYVVRDSSGRDVTSAFIDSTSAIEGMLSENTQYVRYAIAFRGDTNRVWLNEVDIKEDDKVEIYNGNAIIIDMSEWVIYMEENGSPWSYVFPAGYALPAQDFTLLHQGEGIEDLHNRYLGFDNPWDRLSPGSVSLVSDDRKPWDLMRWQRWPASSSGVLTTQGLEPPLRQSWSGSLDTDSINRNFYRHADVDTDTADDWTIGLSFTSDATHGRLNHGQVGLVGVPPAFGPPSGDHAAYTSVHDPLLEDFATVVVAPDAIEVSVTPPPQAFADLTGAEIQSCQGAGCSDWSVLAPFSQSYGFLHAGLTPGTTCYRVRFRNGDGDPTAFSPPVCLEPGACSATAAAQGVRICEGEPAVLDGSASSAANCSGGLEYRWLLEGSPLTAFGTDPMLEVTPPSSSVYILEVRCVSDPACASTVDVAVTVVPDLVPPDLLNSLQAIGSGGDVVLSWDGVAEARTFSLYRGTTKGEWAVPAQRTGLPTPAVSVPDMAGPAGLYFYRVVGVSCSGLEGP